jgi:proteasome lid subunit RPN8/RPN11
VAARTEPAGRPRLFRLEEIPDPEPPLASLDELGLDGSPSSQDGIRIALHASVRQALLRGMPFSAEIEDAGFLHGTVHRDRDAPACHLVTVHEAVPAACTGASMISVTLTGDSFLQAAATCAASHRELIGWYHTHLFTAESGSDLSSVDVDLHLSTFRRPWQIAALVNLAANGTRALRFFRADGQTMTPVRYWTVPG